MNHTLRLLRVVESVRAAEGDAPIGDLYAAYGEAIHHRQAVPDAAEMLRFCALDVSHALAADDDSWDEVIRAHMDEGLALTCVAEMHR